MRRRDFLHSAGLALAPLLVPGLQRRAPLRIALLHPPASGSAALAAALDGARLGIEEASHTYTLLGRALDAFETTDAGARACALVTLIDEPALSTLPSGALAVDARARFACDAARSAFRIGVAETPEPVVLWHPSLERFGATQLNDRFARRFGRDMDEHAWAAWFALKVVAEAGLRAPSPGAAALAGWLDGSAARFDGHKGRPLWFDAERRLVQPIYRQLADGLETLNPEEAVACAS